MEAIKNKSSVFEKGSKTEQSSPRLISKRQITNKQNAEGWEEINPSIMAI